MDAPRIDLEPFDGIQGQPEEYVSGTNGDEGIQATGDARRCLSCDRCGCLIYGQRSPTAQNPEVNPEKASDAHCGKAGRDASQACTGRKEKGSY